MLLGTKRNISIGSGSRVYYKTKITCVGDHKVIIGKNCRIGSSPRCYHSGMPFFTSILCDAMGRVKIGDNCRINGAYIHSQKSIEIGSNCVIAAGVTIMDSNGHELKSTNRTVGRDIPKEIRIGNNVWIGLNAIILKGTNIGDNCVVSAGTVVKGEFPKDCIISTNNQISVSKIEFKK